MVLTDARAESEKAPAGFAGPGGKTHQFFSFEMSGKDLDKLNPFGKKTAVFPCEFFAVLVAQSVWRDQLVNRQVVFYIDNDGVRDVLISCNTSDPVGHVMLTGVLELEGALAISSWFTRVPSKSNVAADNPSRGECKELIAATAKQDQVDPMEVLMNLGLCPKWGRCQARRPNRKRCDSLFLAKWSGCGT